MLTVVFQGIESSTHRDTLLSVKDLFEDPPAITAGISYRALRARRLTSSYVNETAKHFPVVMEAGVFTTSMDDHDATTMSGEYYQFLAETPSITLAVEFDHPRVTEHDVEDPRLLPLWRDSDPKTLEGVLERSGSVATAWKADPRVPALLRRFSAADGVLLALAQPDLAEAKKAGFNAVMTGAWIEPGKRGELSLWDGNKFHRCNSAEKPKWIRKYENTIERYGFDLDLIRNNDARELNRLAAFSFLSWAKSLDLSPDIKEADRDAEVVPLRLASVNTLPRGVKRTRETSPLPIFDTSTAESLEEGEDGVASIRSRSVLRASSETVRVCDSCFLASTCPAYEAGSSCAFNFPVEVRTDSQVKALLNSVMEIQATRVAFARFAEEVNGGYPDAVVGQEIDRLYRMAEKMKKVDEKRERLTVSVESESSGGGTGVLSRIFGEKAAVETPEQPAIEADVIIGEVVEDDR